MQIRIIVTSKCCPMHVMVFSNQGFLFIQETSKLASQCMLYYTRFYTSSIAQMVFIRTKHILLQTNFYATRLNVFINFTLFLSTKDFNMLLKKLKWMADGLMSVNPNSDRIYNTSNNLSVLTNIRSFTTIHLSAAKSEKLG